MSLVAYEYSSDDDTDQDEDRNSDEATTVFPQQSSTRSNKLNTSNAAEEPIEDTKAFPQLALPVPKTIMNGLSVEEEDDEFLRKKAIPMTKPAPFPILTTVKTNVKNGKIQITIPSLRDFKDDTERKPIIKPIGAEKPTGLLSLLPKPKSELAFFTSKASPSVVSSIKPAVQRLIPDSVANRPRNIPSKEAVMKKASAKKPPTDKHGNNSEDSEDEERVDFFSLNSKESLPEISANEINAMVAKTAARMAEAAKQFTEPEPVEEQPCSSGLHPSRDFVLQEQDDLTSERALSSLIGGNKAKRARVDDVNIIEISSADIVPSKEDFLRRKLQEETGYVPTGHLTGDWSCTSKRKSHITYLASKAQDNAQELEAMWSANRQSRRQTQSKYGF
ncbi:proline-rich protein PRCC [Malaya genurostris]|uniref:proline-rich protein PRCC n=1 Tax=Malaya genurostris TaxID=325434 RepID=UPI0026F38A2C|nr:proline-rich protein PRCC [Malaya genurostris]